MPVACQHARGSNAAARVCHVYARGTRAVIEEGRRGRMTRWEACLMGALSHGPTESAGIEAVHGAGEHAVPHAGEEMSCLPTG